MVGRELLSRGKCANPLVSRHPLAELISVTVNRLAWLVGLIFPFLPGPLVDQRTPAAVVGGLFVVSGVAMAVTVATVTGIWLRRVLRPSPDHR